MCENNEGSASSTQLSNKDHIGSDQWLGTTGFNDCARTGEYFSLFREHFKIVLQNMLSNHFSAMK